MRPIKLASDKECGVGHRNSIVPGFSCQVPGEPRIYGGRTMGLSGPGNRAVRPRSPAFQGFSSLYRPGQCRIQLLPEPPDCPLAVRYCAVITMVTMDSLSAPSSVLRCFVNWRRLSLCIRCLRRHGLLRETTEEKYR